MTTNAILLLATASIAFIVTYISVPAVRRLAILNGIVDQPNDRRVNRTPMPRLGGVGIALGLLVSAFGWVLVSSLIDANDISIVVRPDVNFFGTALGVTIIFALGLIDDLLDLRASHKFFGQSLAVTIIVLSGVSINTLVIGNVIIESRVLGFIITLFILLSYINIINLIDGLDGLSTGIVTIASLFGLIVAVNSGAMLSALINASIMGACLSFLIFNKHPASIFMGDAGAMALGAALGVASVLLFMDDSTIQFGYCLLLPISIPIIDTFCAIVRRSREGAHIGSADKNHLHHRLLTAVGHAKAVRKLHLYSAAYFILAMVCYYGQSVGVAVCVILATALSVGIIIRYKLFENSKN